LFQRGGLEFTGWKSFEPWLSRVESFPAEALWRIAEEVPPEWYGGDTRLLEALMETMLKRRSKVRELITAFRDSEREPFPKWGTVEGMLEVAAPQGLQAGGFIM
jgi:hypothetical protein